MLDKSIEHGKEHRKPYRGSKSFDTTCRNHGSCPWCKSDRLHKFQKSELESDYQIEEFNGLKLKKKPVRKTKYIKKIEKNLDIKFNLFLEQLKIPHVFWWNLPKDTK